MGNGLERDGYHGHRTRQQSGRRFPSRRIFLEPDTNVSERSPRLRRGLSSPGGTFLSSEGRNSPLRGQWLSTPQERRIGTKQGMCPRNDLKRERKTGHSGTFAALFYACNECKILRYHSREKNK